MANQKHKPQATPKSAPIIRIGKLNAQKALDYLDMIKQMMLFHVESTESKRAVTQIRRLCNSEIRGSNSHENENASFFLNCVKVDNKADRNVLLVLAMLHCKDVVGRLIDHAYTEYRRSLRGPAKAKAAGRKRN